jgi:hypothetical protein
LSHFLNHPSSVLAEFSYLDVAGARSLMAKIVLIIRNGVVDAIEGIPTDMFVEVRNYDVANLTEDLLSRDADGRACQVKEWRAPE